MIPQSTFQADYRKMAFPVDICYTNQPQPQHWHEEFEIIACMNGYFTLVLDSHFFTFHSGDMAIIPGRCMHSFFHTDTSKIFCMKFSHKLLRNSPDELRDFIGQNNVSLFWSEEVRSHCWSILEQIQEEYEHQADGWRSAISQLLYALQTCSIRCFSRRSDPRQLGTTRASPQIHQILLYISAHYKEEGFSMSDCAKHFNFNRNYFSTMFSQATGVTFHRYLQSLRMRQFEHLLVSTDDPITELCLQAGFSSVKTVNR